MRIKQTKIYLFLNLMILLLMSHASWAQSLQVTGIVIDDKGLPIPGVNINEKGTKNGVNTDFDGKYKISTSAKSVLEFSFIGFDTKQIPVNGQSVINLKMTASSTELNDVVIVAYGKQKKISVTGAISSINAEQLSKSPSANIANTLAGQITGVTTVQSSGRPGVDDPRIFVRGMASISEDRSQPLIIVDGVERSFTSLDADEIESLSVLKDASATAVYGVRGANGVIIVTTKRGTKGKANITASYSKGVQQATKLLDFADSYTYAKNYNLSQLNDNPALTPNQLTFSPEALEAFRTGSNPLIYPNVDWMKYILKPLANQSKANVNVSGGNDNVRYFASIGALSQDGLFKTFDSDYNYNFSFQRYNFRTNLDIDVTKTTKLSVTIGGQVGIINQPGIKNATSNTVDDAKELFRMIYWSTPFASPGIVDGKYIVNNTNYIPLTTVGGLDAFYGLGYTNILENRLNFDLDLTQQLNFVKGLSFGAKLSNNTYYSHTKRRTASTIRYTPIYLKDVPGIVLTPDQDPNQIVFQTAGSTGNLGYSEPTQGKDRSWYLETRLNYNRKFGVHNVGALLLYNEQKDYYPAQYTEIPAGLVGLAGRVTYDFKSKYLADINMGYNGSENFAKAKRFGFFPAFSAGWVISKESFMEALPVISFLKLRMTYGLVGNDKIPGYRFLYLPDSYIPSSAANGYNFGTDNPTNQLGAIEGKIGNPDVTWETATKQNLGVEMKLFKDKLGITVDVFKENRKNILTTRGTIPGFVAYTAPAVNIGVVENKGFEAELNWNQHLGKDFSYRINLNVTHSKNTIIYMDEVPHNQPYQYRTGLSVGQPFGRKFDRFFTEADLIAVNNGTSTLPNQSAILKPGDLIYKDLNGDGKIDKEDEAPIGYPDYPLYNYGINLGLSYKKFDLSMSWAGAAKTSRLLQESFKTPFGGSANRGLLQSMADNAWTPENASTATLPRMSLLANGTGGNNSYDSDFWIRDASYIRLKTMEMGYNFKGDFLRKTGISTLRLYFNGNNLVTFTKLNIVDPESKTSSFPDYPLTKIYNLGVKLNFL